MPSPFPGMNPYLEHPDVWPGFHTRFVTCLQAAVTAVIGQKYHVELVQQHYYSAGELGEETADASVVIEENPTVYVPGVTPLPIKGTIPPIMLDHIPALEVVDSATREPVTNLELLSHVNKGHERNYNLYRSQRAAAFAGWPHFVEIDLLRGGRRMRWRKPVPSHTYSVAVSPRQDRPNVGFWPIQLRDPLPTIPIPLGTDDAPVRVDLQAVLHAAYDDAGYTTELYRNAITPPLPPDDAAWAADLARAATPS
jgi:hypothetical protein